MQISTKKPHKEIVHYTELAATHLSKVLELGVQPNDVVNIQKMYVHLRNISRKYQLDLAPTLDSTQTIDRDKKLTNRYAIKIWVATDGQLGAPDEALLHTLPTASHAFNIAVELLKYTKRHFKVQLVDKATNHQLGIVEIKV